MSIPFKPGFHMIVTFGDLLRQIGDVSPISRRHMETIIVMIIRKPGFIEMCMNHDDYFKIISNSVSFYFDVLLSWASRR